MSVIIYSESENGKFKKSAFELASYGRALADKLGLSLIAISINNNEADPISNFGIDKLIQINKAYEKYGKSILVFFGGLIFAAGVNNFL